MTQNDNKIDYIHWDDLNEIVDRLRLLEASRQAGHNGHDNDILSIIEELREAAGADFDAKSRKIRRVALPVDDADAANKRYVQQSVQDLKDRLNEIERKIAALQNNVQVLLKEFEKTIREVHRAD
ncbi:hypothetical protein ALC57_03110 [Trachymyrmex cornetzi]|uniref:Uncharacterized protein n=1 Tax=Trachymyrmex cornetzi TaxID=471704 RepID=A0A151JMF7_9HYME|nr:hypothetical protein ALC57_03110 [Trachymyrmex cornetzi]